MKKLISLSTICFLLISMLWSCNKKPKENTIEQTTTLQTEVSSSSPITTNSQEIYVSNGILNFSTLDVYENFLRNFENNSLEHKNEWLANYNFTSLHSIGVSEEVEREFEIVGSPIEYILNSNYVVKINNRTCLLDFTTEEVYVTESNDEGVLTQLFNKQTITNLIYKFPFEADVLYIEDLANPEELQTEDGGQYKKCKESGAPKKGKDNCESDEGCPYTLGETTYKVKAKVVYQAMGISFRVHSKLKHRKQGQGINSSPTTLLIQSSQYPNNMNHFVKPKCQSIIPSIWSTQQNPNCSVLDYNSYSSGKALHKYNVYVEFWWAHPFQLTSGQVTLQIEHQ